MSTPQGVGLTALGIARMRAMESAREDHLFDDPYAGLFVNAIGDQLMSGMDRLGSGGSGFWTSMPTYIAVRTRFFDDYFTNGGLRQAVLLAAGLDTRAFRLSWPAGATVFELDLPDLLAFKESVLTEHRARPVADRVPLAVDLRDDWPKVLRDNGFRPDEPTAWLAEGLLMYLTQEENDRLLARITADSAPGSTLAFGHLSAGSLAARLRRTPDSGAAGAVKTMWRSGLDQDPAEWLAGHGWTAQVHTPQGLAPGWGREIPEDSRHGETWLVSATR